MIFCSGLTDTKMAGSAVVGSFQAADYVVFATMLLVSAAVGVYYAWADRGQSTSGEFLVGGRRLTALPVSLSLTASFMSAITVLSNPAEVRIHQCIMGRSNDQFQIEALSLLSVSVYFDLVFYITFALPRYLAIIKKIKITDE